MYFSVNEVDSRSESSILTHIPLISAQVAALSQSLRLKKIPRIPSMVLCLWCLPFVFSSSWPPSEEKFTLHHRFNY